MSQDKVFKKNLYIEVIINFSLEGPFMLRENRRRNTRRVEAVKSYGTCCWKLCDRRRQCEIVQAGQEKVPQYDYVLKGQLKNC